MFCPTCGKQNVDGALYCYACGKKMSLAGAVVPEGVPPAMLPQIPLAPPAPRTLSAAGKLFLALALLIGLGAVLLTPVPKDPGNGPAFTIGYRLGELFFVLLSPFVIAYAIAGRKKARRPNLFAGIFFGLTFVLAGLVAIGSLAPQRPTETTDARIARLIREASGQQPVTQLPGVDGELDTVLRDFLRGVQQRNRDYQGEIRALDQSEMARLYSAYSFSSPQEIQRVLGQLQAALDLDLKQEQALRQLVETAESRIRALDLSDKDKEEAVQGMEHSLVPIYAARGDLMSAEKDWIASTEALYRYGYEQFPQIQIRGSEIFIADTAVREEFNQRWRASRQAEQTFSARKRDFDLKMRSMQGASGISPADVQKLR